ncbi:glycosyltransferase family 2 protein [Pedobacter sp. ASV28]|uniref:glycosyltransferase family 2 protein n=1 Tax=Pedobacter sp. ASV28 TaxID=2795123 RepID=UPI0018ED4179|nr:glycosyltransferase family 2 protein [Pedobacter sp. ASV28]
MDQNRPLINIMIPVYNGQDTLPVAIGSLLYQTYSHWKCIIVNDGSTDGTRVYLDNLHDDRFQVIHLEKNKGRPFARQVALDAAQGQYLAFLDADDFYHPQKLEKQLAIMEQHSEVILTCCANGSYNAALQLETVRGKGPGVPVKFKIGDRRNVVLRTAMVRLGSAKKYQFNTKLKLAEDTDFVDRMLNNHYYLTVPDVLYYYSEFVSVTKGKILKSNYYAMLCAFSLLKNSPSHYAKRVMVNAAKICLKLLVYPFVSVDFYLKKRGKMPSDVESREFEQVNNDLKKYQA